MCVASYNLDSIQWLKDANITRPHTNDSGHATTKATNGIKHYFSTRMVHQAMELENRDHQLAQMVSHPQLTQRIQNMLRSPPNRWPAASCYTAGMHRDKPAMHAVAAATAVYPLEACQLPDSICPYAKDSSCPAPHLRLASA